MDDLRVYSMVCFQDIGREVAMIYKMLSDRILDHLSQNTNVDMEYREVYAYAIERYFSGIINGILFSGIAIACQIPIEAIVFFAFYSPLRRYAGGRHAKTRTRCLILSVITMFTVIRVAIFLSAFDSWRILSLVGMLLAGLLVFLFAPVDCENKRFTEEIKLQNKKTSRRIVIGEILILIAAIQLQPSLRIYIVIAVMALLLEGIILIPNINNNKEEKNNEK
jgi:accessory gene regulator B